MSEFELAYMQLEYGNSIALVLGTYITGLFAMLIASHYIASKLDRFITILVLIIFTLFSIYLGRGAFNSAFNYFSVGGILREGEWGSPLLKMLADNAPTGFQTTVAPFIVVAIILLTYIGAVIFFFKSRKP